MAWRGNTNVCCDQVRTLFAGNIPDSFGRNERASEMRRGELSMTEETVDWETRVTMTGKGGFSMAGK